MSPLVWLITGTSSGFGRRLVDCALARQDRVIATARSIDKLVFQGSNHDNLRIVQLDITDSPADIKLKIDEAVALWGRVDVLVNNAGVGYPGILEVQHQGNPPLSFYRHF